ncbi:MAG: PAS domain S-box protein [Dehalococcoidales bacterium]|nr:PAS domain S-box protein [Dehalococcoidales bacterium]
MELSRGEEKNVSCRVTKTLLEYLKPNDIELEYLLEGLAYSKEYLDDSSNWITPAERDEFCRRAIDLRNDKTFMYHAGLLTPDIQGLGGMKTLVRLLGTPRIAYENVPKYSSWFDKNISFNTEIISPQQARIIISNPGNLPFSKNACYYAQGILASIPTIWGLPPARIQETKCMCPENDTCTIEGMPVSSDVCEYIVSWEPVKFKITDYIKNAFRFLHKLAIKSIEEDLDLADQKTTELTLRNMQISKIREMALAVSQIQSKNELFSTVVELIRDMPNVRFVTVLEWEDEENTLTVPCYSRVRNTAIKKLLKAVGFDFDKELGVKPDSNAFKINVARSSTFKEYLDNPGINTSDSLAQVLDGIWPQKLCDSVQKVAGIKSIGIIPIQLNGKFKAGVVIYQTDMIRKDILEMIWAHCREAIQNLENIETLKKTNEELNQAEQNFRNSIDSSPLGVQILTRNGTLLYANQAMLDIYGFDSIEELKKPLSERYTPETYREHMHRIALLDAGKEIPLNYEIKIVRKDGEIRHLAVIHNEVIWDKEVQYQLLYQDITESRQMHQQLILADRLVSVGELAAGIAHEINNPLTSIIMYSEDLKDGNELAETIKNDIEIINQEANRAAEIIRKMILFARKHEINTLPVNINEVINSTLQLRAYEHKVKNIDVQTLLADNIPDIAADNLQLQQVFLNIIINAEFFMFENEGKGTLVIKTETKDNSVYVTFTDSGPGIKEADMIHLFDPFFTTKDVGKGTGLGLSICHGIIESYGGRIYARNEDEGGVTFIIELPVQRID